MDIDKIYLGDAYKLIKEIPDKSVDLIVTDPPYIYEALNGQGISHLVESFNELKNTNLNKGFEISFLDELVRVSKKINIYIWVSKDQFKNILDYMVDKYHCRWDLLIWAKSNPPPLCSHQYLHDCEYCLYFRDRGVLSNMKFETARTIYFTSINQADKKRWGHPTIKPEEIIKNLISNSSGGGSLILDPFSGSGTTCVIAKRLGRHYIGFEINKDYYEKSINRMKGLDQTDIKNIELGQLRLFE